MKIGIFDHLDRTTIPLHDFYEQRLRIVEAYDRAGFYSYHIAEHHSTPLGMAPSPGIFLSAVAQRTQRLRFGPAVYLLPLYHPLRLAEEIAMLDHLSGGRLDVGIGRGISPIETMLYGGDPSHAQDKFDEAFAVINLAMGGDRLDFHGTHFTFENVPVTVTPLQTPHPPWWYGVSSPESAARCVDRGFNALSLAPTRKATLVAGRFNERAAECGRDDLLFGLARFIVVGETDADALRIARRAYRVWHKSFHHLYHAYGRAPVQGDRPAEFDGMMDLGIGVAGSVETVRAALRAQLDATGANYLVGQFVFGDMTLDEALASLGAFAAGVMPELVARPVAAR